MGAGGAPFLERMVEAGKGITAHFGPRITYINVLKNISVDCDCNAQGVKPTSDDIGILGSTDILAIDKASVDLMHALPEEQRRDMGERIESRSGLRQLEYMKILHVGNDQYELITIWRKKVNLSIEENPPFEKGGQKPPQVHPRNILPIASGNNMNRDANTEF